MTAVIGCLTYCLRGCGLGFGLWWGVRVACLCCLNWFDGLLFGCSDLGFCGFWCMTLCWLVIFATWLVCGLGFV